ncbi:MAG: response regulator [Clostridia bacterium]|nr:response regulator [Clostridia bacterium]
METVKRRAVIASAGMNSATSILRSLDDTAVSPCAFAVSGSEAVEQIHVHRPDFVIADLILPGMDGIHLARHVMNLPLDRHPGFILLDPAGCTPSAPEWLWDCGVSVIPKAQLSEKLTNILPLLSPERRFLPPQHSERLKTLMDELGVPQHPGREYLSDAAAIVWMDSRYLGNLKKQLYQAVAGKHSTDAARVERAMRYAIDKAWRTGEITRQHRIFGDTIDARRGKPTCGEMIARLADILRWEGRQ